MSIRVNGTVILNEEASEKVETKIAVAYTLIDLSVKHRVGFKLGGNATRSPSNDLTKSRKGICFDLMDDPLDVNAERLFIGDGIKLIVCGQQVDENEPLCSRMHNIQCLLSSILVLKEVENIELSVNVEDGDIVQMLAINVKDFASIMLTMYERGNNWTPTIKLTIN